MKLWRYALLGVCSCLLAGCAQQNLAITTVPSHDELPAIPETGRVTPMTVAVAGVADQPHAKLTPDFRPPELTPEEREVMGVAVPHYRFLSYNQFFAGANRRVGSWFGGVRAHVFGRGGAAVLVDAPTSISGRSGRGGVLIAVDPVGHSVGGVHGERTQVYTAGPSGGIRVGADPRDKRIAAPRPRDER